MYSWSASSRRVAADPVLINWAAEMTSGAPRVATATPYAESVRANERVCLWQGDITTLRVDAIVNAANSGLWGNVLVSYL